MFGVLTFLVVALLSFWVTIVHIYYLLFSKVIDQLLWMHAYSILISGSYFNYIPSPGKSMLFKVEEMNGLLSGYYVHHILQLYVFKLHFLLTSASPVTIVPSINMCTQYHYYIRVSMTSRLLNDMLNRQWKRLQFMSSIKAFSADFLESWKSSF